VRPIIGSNDGRFYVLDLSTDAKVWEFNAGAAVSASPAIAGGRVVIGAQDEKLYYISKLLPLAIKQAKS